MMRSRIKLLGGILFLLCGGTFFLNAYAGDFRSAKPNIVFMMADDVGYNDLACYGQRLFPTPHTDRLATEGIRLTDAHSPSAVCTPTRYAVLTGTDPFRRYHTSHVLFNGEPLIIRKGESTVASLLKKNGYRTGVVGKWHLGLGDKLPRNLDNPGRGPNDIGFDYSFIVPDGHNMFPRYYIENGKVAGGTNPPFSSKQKILSRVGYRLFQNVPDGEWENRRPEDRIGATLADRVDGFIERNKDQPFFLYYPTCSIHVPLVPDARFQGESGIGPHGDFVMEFDWAVGRVMATLDRLGLAENTLLIVTSDNGGYDTVEGTNHRPTHPWRGYKMSAYEGGHRVPFLAKWPGKIMPETVTGEMVSLTDLMATAAEVTGMPLPTDAAMDSFSMLPGLRNQPDGGRCRPGLVAGERAMRRILIRQGAWKLILEPEGGRTELYNLAVDPVEQNDLAETHPEKLQELLKQLNHYIETGHSRPGAQGKASSFERLFIERNERNNRIKDQ